MDYSKYDWSLVKRRPVIFLFYAHSDEGSSASLVLFRIYPTREYTESEKNHFQEAGIWNWPAYSPHSFQDFRLRTLISNKIKWLSTPA
jgi:hypothetical protein